MQEVGQRGEVKHVVGVVHPFAFEDVATLLARRAEVRIAASVDEAGVAALAAEVDGLIIRGPARLTGAMLASSPRLRAVAVTGSGTDHVDLEAATRHGVPVACGAGVSPEAVAEYVVGAIIAARRRLFSFHEQLTSGELDWPARLRDRVPHQVMGAHLGLVGLGHIGRAVARVAVDGLRMQVLAYDPLLASKPDHVTMVDDLDEVLTTCDVVSINVALTDETRGMIGRDELRLIGSGGVLVNTSRGRVVDEAALIAALRAGELGAAVVDVFDVEPPSRARLHELRDTPNLIVTPHIAGVTYETRHRLERNAVDQVLAALDGSRPTTLANPDVVFPTPSVVVANEAGA